MRFFVIFFTFFCLFAKSGFAEEIQEKFHDWTFFKTQKETGDLCYLVSTPIKQENPRDRFGEPFIAVTHVNNEGDEVRISSGFIYNKESDVEVSFPLKKFYLFPHHATAWSNDKNDDIDIIKEMQRHEGFIVAGVSKNNKIFIDTYSLIGFFKAYHRMKEVCRDLGN